MTRVMGKDCGSNYILCLSTESVKNHMHEGARKLCLFHRCAHTLVYGTSSRPWAKVVCATQPRHMEHKYLRYDGSFLLMKMPSSQKPHSIKLHNGKVCQWRDAEVAMMEYTLLSRCRATTATNGMVTTILVAERPAPAPTPGPEQA